MFIFLIPYLKKQTKNDLAYFFCSSTLANVSRCSSSSWSLSNLYSKIYKFNKFLYLMFFWENNKFAKVVEGMEESGG
jgi:hypothetical protein